MNYHIAENTRDRRNFQIEILGKVGEVLHRLAIASPKVAEINPVHTGCAGPPELGRPPLTRFPALFVSVNCDGCVVWMQPSRAFRRWSRDHFGKVAEEEGFEPPVDLRPRLISSQVPLTTQPFAAIRAC